MGVESQRPSRDGALSSLNVAIGVMNIAEEGIDVTPAKATLASVSVIRAMIKVGFLLSPICRSLANVYKTP